MTMVKKLLKKKNNNLITTSPKRIKKKMSREKNIPSDDLTSYPILVHGAKGIGKTTLFSQFPGVYYAMFENNASYAFHMDYIQTWEDFLDIKDEFMSNPGDFKAFVLDNPKNMWDLSLDYSCAKFGFNHPGENKDFGASWSKVVKEFNKPVRSLMNSGKGLFISCHSKAEEFKTPSGMKYKKIIPNISGSAYELLVGEVYNVFYYFYDSGKSWLQIVGSEYVEAKNRMKGHFLTTNGEAVYKIPTGNSEQEAYENLMKAFNNKQELSYQPVKLNLKPLKTLKRKET